MKLEDITIVVPTKNEMQNIASFLGSLAPEVKLIVVDASADETPLEILRLRPKNTRVIGHPGNISEARQAGADGCTTSWILCTDADVTFDPGYFDRLRDLKIEARDGGVVGAKSSELEYRGYYRWFRRGQRLLMRMGIPAATGSNMLIRRSALHIAGGFDPQLFCNEDSEVMWRIKRKGWHVRFEESLVVYEHDHRRLRGGVLRKLVHSVLRCFVLYVNWIPASWRRSDWGYWNRPRAA